MLAASLIRNIFHLTKRKIIHEEIEAQVLIDKDNHYYDLKYENRVAIVMGCEKYGIDETWYKTDYTSINIPMLGSCDSLNVGVAATIIMYEVALKNKGIMKR